MTEITACCIDDALREAEAMAQETLPSNDPDLLSKVAAVIVATNAIKSLQSSINDAVQHLEQTLSDLKGAR